LQNHERSPVNLQIKEYSRRKEKREREFQEPLFANVKKSVYGPLSRWRLKHALESEVLQILAEIPGREEHTQWHSLMGRKALANRNSSRRTVEVGYPS
jgi:hypothetical protein